LHFFLPYGLYGLTYSEIAICDDDHSKHDI
jgi:hypothetical protein